MADTDLTLPGSIPGLLRRGSPVVLTQEYLESYFTAHANSLGVFVYLEGGEALVAVTAKNSGEDVLISLPLDHLALDLIDITGRFHAACWLDAKCNRVGTWLDACRWHVRRLGYTTTVAFGPWENEGQGYICYSLGELDPSDTRLLNDGSRFVDAEALRRVVLRVVEMTRG